MGYSFASRQQWGARYGTGSPDPGAEPRVVIHHSYKPALSQFATAQSEIQAIRGIEVHHAEVNGWAGIGYNWLVAPSGRIYEGRGWAYKGAHAGPVNGTSIGICILVDGNEWEPTPTVIKAVRTLIAGGVRLGEISPTYLLSGHRDHMDRACPGDKIYARLQEFRHDVNDGVVIEAVVPEVTRPAAELPVVPPNLKVIYRPRPIHIDYIAKARGVTPEQIREGVEVIEVLGRAVLQGKEATLKDLVDAAADWIKGQL